MKAKRKRAILRQVGLVTLFSFLFQIIAPSAYALTSGPSQPEFTSFEPVSTAKMVDEFSGDFTYNLPLMEVPGPGGSSYPLSLSYHSGVTPEEEASWVGYGWTLNPGAINRSKKGFPDDWKDRTVTYHNRVPDNMTVGITADPSFEGFSTDMLPSFSGGLRFNNYKGFSSTMTVGVSVFGMASLGYTYGSGDGSFSLSVQPAKILSTLASMAGSNKETDTEKKPDGEVSSLDNQAQMTQQFNNNKGESGEEEGNKFSFGDAATRLANGISVNMAGGTYGILTHDNVSRPTVVTEFEGNSFTFNFEFTATMAQLQMGMGGSSSGAFNVQRNIPVSDEQVFGYLYSGSNDIEDEDMMDYRVELESMYNKRDRNLSIPINNSDAFMVTGEGVGGGFRLYNKGVRTYRPHYKMSETLIEEVGVAVDAGSSNNGGGATIAIGDQRLKVSSWPSDQETQYFPPEQIVNNDENVLARFNGDLGGAVLYDSDLAKQKATFDYTPIGGEENYTPSTSHITTELNGNLGPDLAQLSNRPVGRSSYVGYNLNEDLVGEPGIGDIPYKAYEKSSTAGVDHSHPLIQGQIGEYSISNDKGMRYNYGLPVFARNERKMSVDLFDPNPFSSANIHDNYLARKNVDWQNHQVEVGEESMDPYATAYLLTSIETPDYVDRTFNGPSEDDFGGYTKFAYERHRGGLANGNWYHWRAPYQNLIYERNALSDAKDDLASFQEGDKEVYYLDSIVTKTHYALFYTSDRADGREAESGNASSNATFGTQAMGSDGLKKLDKIELFAKGDANSDPVLIKTVRFDYDYELCPGTLNSTGGDGDGKLTLRKVWFEHQGIVTAQIAPYEFAYQYPDYPNFTYPDPYSNSAIDQFYGQFSDLDQNPSYYPQGLDPWGNYQADGVSRYGDMQRWVDQSPDPAFDPAAWQLKVIKLPSGGEIHVQYEQDDYSFVQDQQAHAMVSIKPGVGDLFDNTITSNGHARQRFHLNVEGDLAPGQSLQDLADDIERLYVNTDKRMFFKFLYKLNGAPHPTQGPQIDHCNAEYIDGYCRVQNVGIDADGLFVTLDGDPAMTSNYMLPRQVCIDFVKTQRQGMLTTNSSCDPTNSTAFAGGSPTAVFENAVNFIMAELAGPFDDLLYCLTLNPELSYFRVPITDKLGGGVRVKRILMYDEGDPEANSAALYGSEYIYKEMDGELNRWVSSGVAANEPASLREESALVYPLVRDEQDLFDRIISGKDRKQSEGPLGETLLPGPSVGYRQVYIKNIHSGRTNPGFTVKNFHTARQFPFKGDQTGIHREKHFLPLTFGVVNYTINNVWLSQGYLFETNQMHGAHERTSTYAGDYRVIFPTDDADPSNDNAPINMDLASLITYEHTEYFEPGESIPVLNDLKELEGPESAFTKLPLGIEQDITMESRKVSDITHHGAVEFDLDAGIFTPYVVPFFSLFPSYSRAETELYQHVTTKVINYPVIPKRITTMRDGILYAKENVAFDPNTGRPLITRSYDGFHDLAILGNTHKGSYTDYTVPASMDHRHMTQRALSEDRYLLDNDGYLDLVLFDGGLSDPFIGMYGDGVCEALDLLLEGDLIEVTSAADNNTVYGVFHVRSLHENIMDLYPVSYSGDDDQAPWNWAGFGEEEVNIHILRSARTNRLKDVVGKFTTYGEKETPVTVEQWQNIDPESQMKEELVIDLNQLVDAPGTVITVSGEPYEDLEFSNGSGCYTLNGSLTSNQTSDGIDIELPGGTGTIIGSTGDFIVNSSNSSVCSYATAPPAATGLEACLSMVFPYEETVADQSPACVSGTDFSGLSTIIKTDLDNEILFLADVLNTGLVKGTTAQSIPPGNYVLQVDLAYKKLQSEFQIYLCNSSDLAWPNQVGDIPSFNHIMIHDGILANANVVCASGPPLVDQMNNFNLSFPVPSDGMVYDALVIQLDNDFISSMGGSGFGHGFGLFIDNMQVQDERTIEYSGCTIEDVQPGDEFAIDEETGSLILKAESGCYNKRIDCIKFCNNAYPGMRVEDVVVSSANTLDEDWTSDLAMYDYGSSYPFAEYHNPFEDAQRGKWRLDESYSYRSSINSIGEPVTHSTSERNYNSGMYDLEVFNWKYPQGNDAEKWLELTEVNSYSPMGEAIEEENILGIKSAALFGYDQSVPIMVTANSAYGPIMFEGFEKTYEDGSDTYFEKGVLSDNTYGSQTSVDAHTGESSLNLSSDQSGEGHGLIGFLVDQELIDHGLVSKLWARSPNGSDPQLQFRVVDALGAEISSSSYELVSEVGDWALYEATTDVGTNVGDLNQCRIVNAGSSNVYVDDLRVQPKEAQATAYVYDRNTLKPIASFDDQNFALLYQYNAEGKLTRKQVETEIGVRTVKETQYNTPRWQDRPAITQ